MCKMNQLYIAIVIPQSILIFSSYQVTCFINILRYSVSLSMWYEWFTIDVLHSENLSHSNTSLILKLKLPGYQAFIYWYFQLPQGIWYICLKYKYINFLLLPQSVRHSVHVRTHTDTPPLSLSLSLTLHDSIIWEAHHLPNKLGFNLDYRMH